MLTEFFAAVEQYTIAQLLAATPFMLVVWLVIREVNGVVRGSGGRSQLKTAFDTIGMIAGNQDAWQGRMTEHGKALEVVSNNQKEQSQAMEKVVTIIEKLYTKVTSNEKEDEQTRADIAELKADSTNTKQVVAVMSDDVENIKSTIDEIKEKVEAIASKQESGEALSKQHQTTLDLILAKLIALEAEKKPETKTDEAPKVAEVKTKEVTK
ncbi:MAG: hypothetical protein ACYTBJ_26715 [Planctomycetota bacterium]|jgi:chromosome segregation ATPase